MLFTAEPPTGNPLLDFPAVVATPHLGASTQEAQEKAGTQVVRSLRLALAGEFVPDAVNVQGGAVDEDVKPGLPLTEKLGQLFTALAGGVAARLAVEVRGEIASKDVRVLQLAALKGVFSDIVEDVEPDMSVREAKVGDRYLLCSDGLSTVITTQAIRDTLRGSGDPDQAVQRLIEAANAAGGPDNVSCVVADIVHLA